MKMWDIAVIGGGLAGSAAAALLAQQGLRVVLCEKGKFPRQKVCGEFLSPEAVGVLQRLGVWPFLLEHRPPRIHSLTLSAGEKATTRQLPVPGWGMSRWLLDHRLWEHARHVGVTTYESCPVRQVEGDWQHGFTLTLQPANLVASTLQARAVLLASGRQWKFPGEHGRLGRSSQARFVGLKTYVQGVALGGRVELHSIRGGYCGLVDVTGDVSNLCCWVAAGDFQRMGGNPTAFLTAALRQNRALSTRLHGAEQIGMPWYTTSIADRRTPTPLTDGLWNLGDRAAMVAPLTGDGMGMALRAAELAAKHLMRAFRAELPWVEAPAVYRQGWRQEFLPRLRWGRLLEWIVLEPRLTRVAAQMMHWMPALTNVLYRHTRGINALANSPADT